MRAIGRRIKKLGYNWKDKGVGKIARIVLKLFATEGEWEEYWRKLIPRSSSQTLPHYLFLPPYSTKIIFFLVKMAVLWSKGW